MIVVLLVALITITASAEAKSLNVTVYYESLCPDSKKFITTQLYPSYELISDYLNVEFIPFGNAKVANNSDGTLNFTCQHGPKECHGNEVQACAISVDVQNSMEFVNCAMASSDPSDDNLLEQCAELDGISWDSIEDCMTNGLAEKLFVQNGARTGEAKISYVPTIVFNGVFNDTLQDSGEHHFLSTACQLLDKQPKICASVN
ncbi:GILT-like protein 1 [Tenebrio molitor]|jgi:interferon gamma-inducible protein 30|uniref:GILT-like protein 1 n=1 Tax=Tenebrio molitor TaxID=7067 RepID=UPI001C39CCCD|nr:unnamed protein product [Tenebrio molitor]